MAMITISEIAKEKSTLVVNVAFTDEDGAAAIPTALSWSLTDTAGTVINSRSSVSVAVPAASNDIVLSGLDLAMQSGESGDYAVRIFTAEATYTSTLGTGLPVKEQASFMVENLTKVS